eukprot:764180-Hanusia_phi.AAC.1
MSPPQVRMSQAPSDIHLCNAMQSRITKHANTFHAHRGGIQILRMQRAEAATWQTARGILSGIVVDDLTLVEYQSSERKKQQETDCIPNSNCKSRTRTFLVDKSCRQGEEMDPVNTRMSYGGACKLPIGVSAASDR